MAQRETAPTGRTLGPRALRTRQRLLDATAELLEERGVLELTVADIARKAETSPGLFYHYFREVEEAALVLAQQAADEMSTLLELFDGVWIGHTGLERARALARGFVEHWESHRAVLLLRNHSADRGDRRFHRVRRRALGPLIESIETQIRISKDAGRLPDDLHPYLAASALVQILEGLSAYAREVHRFHATRNELIETCARMIHGTLNGYRTR